MLPPAAFSIRNLSISVQKHVIVHWHSLWGAVAPYIAVALVFFAAYTAHVTGMLGLPVYNRLWLAIGKIGLSNWHIYQIASYDWQCETHDSSRLLWVSSRVRSHIHFAWTLTYEITHMYIVKCASGFYLRDIMEIAHTNSCWLNSPNQKWVSVSDHMPQSKMPNLKELFSSEAHNCSDQLSEAMTDTTCSHTSIWPFTVYIDYNDVLNSGGQKGSDQMFEDMCRFMINLDHSALNVYTVLVSYGFRDEITLKELSMACVGDLFDKIVFTRYRTREERLKKSGTDQTPELEEFQYQWWRETRWWKTRPRWTPAKYATWSGGKDEYFKHCCPERTCPQQCPDVAVFIDDKQGNLQAAQLLVPQMKCIHFTRRYSRFPQSQNDWQTVHTLPQLAKVVKDFTEAHGKVNLETECKTHTASSLGERLHWGPWKGYLGNRMQNTYGQLFGV